MESFKSYKERNSSQLIESKTLFNILSIPKYFKEMRKFHNLALFSDIMNV